MSLQFDSPAVIAHLQGLQGTVTRLAGNSAQCKTWSVTLLAALLVLSLKDGVAIGAALGLFPIVIFAFLDAYYLSLERRVRNRYIEFADSVRATDPTPGSPEALIFHFGNTETRTSIWVTFRSEAVYPFYLGLAVVAALSYWLARTGLLTGAGNCPG